jgi:sulfite exporter TauE/SafE
MSTTLVATALLMGLAGGPHCAAMCGAACSGAMRIAGPPTARTAWVFQSGRIAGYALAGAAAAAAVQSLAWASTSAAALRPAWVLFHLAVLGWGLALLVLARQPAWAGTAAQRLWNRVRPQAGRGSVFAAGALWALMPCGLLYSALLVASLTGSVAGGALAMALFAAGSAVSLVIARALLLRLQRSGNAGRDWGTRLSGLLLVGAAGWALWMDLGQRIAAWCGIAA